MTEAVIERAIGSAIAHRVLPELLSRHAPPLLDARTLRALADQTQAITRGMEDDAALLAAVLAAVPDRDRNEDRSVPLPLLCREILAPIAHELGERWVRDEISFTAVTIGTGRLHAVLRALSWDVGAWDARAWDAGVAPRMAAPRILMLPAPGENHRLGLSMAAALFRDAGWIVQTGEPENEAALGALLDRLPPDLVGFSASCDRNEPALADAVEALRRMRPGLPVVAGGSLLDRRPGLARRLRLDAAFTDGTAAPERAVELLRERRLPGTARDPSTMLGRLRHREGEFARAATGAGTRGAGAPRSLGTQDLRSRRARRGSHPQDRAGDG